MSSPISRAREDAMQAGGDDPYLNNDELISNQAVFGIVDIIEEQGRGFAGGNRWVLKVEPYFEDDEQPKGLITLADNSARNRFMKRLIKELDDLEEAGADVVIGPVVLVMLKGKNNRYIDIADWDQERNEAILPEGSVLASAKIEEDLRPTRPRSDGRVRTRETAEGRGASTSEEISSVSTPRAAPSFAEADEGKAAPASAAIAADGEGKPRSRRERPGKPKEFPAIKEWAKSEGLSVPEGRGRVKAEIRQAYDKAKAYWEREQSRGTPNAFTQGSSRDVEDELAAQATRRAQTPTRAARPPTGGPTRPEALIQPGGGHSAQEMVFTPGMSGVTIEPCPACKKKIHDRVFPDDEILGGYALIHTCEADGEQRKLASALDLHPS